MKKKSFLKYFKDNYILYLFILPAFLIILIFNYFPLYGLTIAFKNYSIGLGITGSKWVGFEHFGRFLTSPQFWEIFKSTLLISVYDLLWGFPAPILLALMLNQVRKKWFCKTVQMITYAPHFISTVVVVSMITIFTQRDTGIINRIITVLGGEGIPFMEKVEWFRTIFVFTNIWQGIGWSSIVYLAALSGISQELHEAAIVDGASKLKRILVIDIPGIMPTAVIMLIMRIGQILNTNFEKLYAMQNAINLPVSRVIQTYVYELGIKIGLYDIATAVGMFNSVICLILILTANKISKIVTETSLW